MSRYIETQTPGGVIIVEVEDDGKKDGFKLVGAKDKLPTFEEASKALKKNARYLLDLLDEMAPDEIEVSCGIKAGVEGGSTFWVLAKASAEASYTVKLKWKKEIVGIVVEEEDEEAPEESKKKSGDTE